MRNKFYGVQDMIVSHKMSQPVTFGDCDPAGIVFYPNFFAWFDRTFHDWLREFGGHADICKSLGALGIGLMGVDAKFRAPVYDGDMLEIALSVISFERKALHLVYEGKIGGSTVVLGKEVRGLFKKSPAGMIAGDMQELNAYLVKNGFPENTD